MIPLQYREAPIVADSLNESDRTFDIVWTAGAAVPRVDWFSGQRFMEVLEVTPQAVRLDRLKSGRAPVLDSHARWSLQSVLGNVIGKSVKIAGGEGRATVRLSKREEIAGLVADIRDGIIGNVSPGYITHAYREEMRDGTLYRVATDWEPTEISFVPVGADPDAGRRNAQGAPEGPTYPCRILRVGVVATPAAARMRMRQAQAGIR
jgi:hypothetical protein